MNKLHTMLFVMSFGITFGLSQLTHSEETPKTDDKMLCLSNADLDKTMTEKGFDILLNMKNADDVVQSVWTSGQQIIITAAVPNQDKSCLLVTMSNVTFNPKAIENIWETYKKQTNQKDI